MIVTPMVTTMTTALTIVSFVLVCPARPNPFLFNTTVPVTCHLAGLRTVFRTLEGHSEIHGDQLLGQGQKCSGHEDPDVHAARREYSGRNCGGRQILGGLQGAVDVNGYVRRTMTRNGTVAGDKRDLEASFSHDARKAGILYPLLFELPAAGGAT